MINVRRDLHPTKWGHAGRIKKKPRYLLDSGVSLTGLGWLMGLDPHDKKALKIKDLQSAAVICVVKFVTPTRDTRKTTFLKFTW